jgi:hypothetical protein
LTIPDHSCIIKADLNFITGEDNRKGERYMRRTEAPFNNKQFILNKSTGEIHDLDRESPLCCIDEIDADNIFACDTYAEAVLFASVFDITRNGCAHCIPEHHRD